MIAKPKSDFQSGLHRFTDNILFTLPVSFTRLDVKTESLLVYFSYINLLAVLVKITLAKKIFPDKKYVRSYKSKIPIQLHYMNILYR